MKTSVLLLSILLNFSSCRDFYVGMFKKNDFLVAQDTVYKARVPFRFAVAQYGRIFICPITYFRVVDRLGSATGSRVLITRGGLRKKYLSLRITSSYNHPISVNIYIGCENNIKTTTTVALNTTTAENTTTTVAEGETTVVSEQTGGTETTDNVETTAVSEVTGATEATVDDETTAQQNDD